VFAYTPETLGNPATAMEASFAATRMAVVRNRVRARRGLPEKSAAPAAGWLGGLHTATLKKGAQRRKKGGKNKKKKKPSEPHAAVEALNADGDCAICLEPLADAEEIKVLQCRHAFCTDCVREWTHECYNASPPVAATCPNCRVEIL